MHAGGDDEFVHFRQHALLVDQEFRDDADHMTAAGNDGTGDFAHQAEAAAAIDETDPQIGHGGAERLRCRHVDRISTRSRSAINTKMPHDSPIVIWPRDGRPSS